MTITIAAVSTPPGPARRGVVRLSGPEAHALVSAALIETDTPFPADAPRAVVAGRLHDGRGTQPVRVLWMPGPHSTTREDVAELHLPGAPPLLARALARLLELGAAPAAPGEFTRRAFLNGRLDLSQAEGVLALVEAADEAERRAAVELLAGGLERRVRGLRTGLEELRALCEASLDFDEADTGHVPLHELVERTDALAAELAAALSWEVRRQAPSALPRVQLFGAPNAGKSSLFNALAEEGEALVSELAGTTRDALSALWRPASSDCLLLDAPGLDPGSEGPDATAQRLAAREREAADLVLWVVDGGAADRVALERDARTLPRRTPRILVWNKTDLPGVAPTPPPALAEVLAGVEETVTVSAATGAGLEQLADATAAALGLGVGPGPPAASLSRELFARHREALELAARALGTARERLGDGTPLDLCAEALREATNALDGILGRTTPEDLLDRIFARFCLGK